jgi:hypothetical protein
MYRQPSSVGCGDSMLRVLRHARSPWRSNSAISACTSWSAPHRVPGGSASWAYGRSPRAAAHSAVDLPSRSPSSWPVRVCTFVATASTPPHVCWRAGTASTTSRSRACPLPPRRGARSAASAGVASPVSRPAGNRSAAVALTWPETSPVPGADERGDTNSPRTAAQLSLQEARLASLRGCAGPRPSITIGGSRRRAGQSGFGAANAAIVVWPTRTGRQSREHMTPPGLGRSRSA